ncbi:hypothetical protein [Noviherbaspirillum aerium]|uniref:hypothetical protein n=1 Tax=Noviherbaspirillum aerium TaxID=2588497 RepID=UPI001CEF6D94|nr:hypothetical protein [Noviherbaspirillum aerium]
MLDHGQCRPVLHGACRIVSLQLAEDDVIAAGGFVARQSLQLHQRRVADSVFNSQVRHGKFECFDKRAILIVDAMARIEGLEASKFIRHEIKPARTELQGRGKAGNGCYLLVV